MSSQYTLPTEQEIDQVFDVVRRYTMATKTDADREALRIQRERIKALIDECGNLQNDLFGQILDALPEDQREAFRFYGIMAIAPYAVNSETLEYFRSFAKKAKQLLTPQEGKP